MCFSETKRFFSGLIDIVMMNRIREMDICTYTCQQHGVS